jgi:hypothetical protein
MFASDNEIKVGIWVGVSHNSVDTLTTLFIINGVQVTKWNLSTYIAK